MTLAAIAIATLGAGSLAALHRRERRQALALRAAFFDDCMPLLASCRVVRTPFGYPVLEGLYHGRTVRLEPLVDSIAPRKLPSLWLKVTVLAPVRYDGVFDFLRRPQGTEFYSPASQLDHRIAVPQGWPADSQIATDAPELLPPLELLARHIGIFDDPRAKEMLITQTGVRLVYQVSQAERAHYAVLRQAIFPENRLRAELAARLLNAAAALHREVAA